jgi:putative two-component system response regulator
MGIAVLPAIILIYIDRYIILSNRTEGILTMSKYAHAGFEDISILLVEDEKAVARLIELSLKQEAGTNINVHNEAYLEEAMKKNAEFHYDIVLLDLNLPDSRGMATLSTFIQRFPDTPIIILTALEDPEFALSVVKEGAQDYLIKGETEPPVLLRSIYYSIERNKMLIEKKKAQQELQVSYERLKKISDGIILAMEKIVETRDPYTAGHQKRVAELARAMSIKMGFSDEKVTSIYTAAIIHDIGKIYVPAEILSKPGKLSSIEFSIIKTHPQVGYDILRTIEFPWPIDRMVFQHHERINGSGYPLGLKGDEIMEEARIISVADVVEAMASSRPYRTGLGIDAALEEISMNKGTLYYTEAVDACLELFRNKSFAFV